ncbi:MAG: hypothetical protein AB1489_09510 [Acidobacteriota bacterium]
MRKFGKALLIGALALGFAAPAERPVAAQGGEGLRTSTPIAVGEKVFCAGFVSETKVNPELRIIGALNGTKRIMLVRGERAYINQGSPQGIQVGQIFQIIRPLGTFRHPYKTSLHFPTFTRRGEQLGYYVEEMGFARVVAVQDKTSTIEITESCSDIRLGDALVPYQKPDLPDQRPFVPLDQFAAPTGKTSGQIIYARSSREQLSNSDVVFIDIGQKAGVRVGDYFTIFREYDTDGVLLRYRDEELSQLRVNAGSDRYRGSEFSIIRASEGQRPQDINKQYPRSYYPRKVVGELVVTRVEGNTATAVIVRSQSGEITVGDKVELQ